MWSISEYIGSANSTVTSSTTSSLPISPTTHPSLTNPVFPDSTTEELNVSDFFDQNTPNQDLPMVGQDRSFSMLDVYGLARSITELYQEIFYSSLPNRPFPLLVGLIGSAKNLDEVFEKLEDLCYLIDQALTA